MRLATPAGELLRSVESAQLKTKLPAFAPGDTLRVTFRVSEGDKERQQVFEGVVISRRGGGTREMVTVRKISFGIGVERMFPLHSPFVVKLEVVGRGKVRRAKLYYLRDKIGKAARIKRQYMEETGSAAPTEQSSAQPTPAEAPPALAKEQPAPTPPPVAAEKAVKATKR